MTPNKEMKNEEGHLFRIRTEKIFLWWVNPADNNPILPQENPSHSYNMNDLFLFLRMQYIEKVWIQNVLSVPRPEQIEEATINNKIFLAINKKHYLGDAEKGLLFLHNGVKCMYILDEKDNFSFLFEKII